MLKKNQNITNFKTVQLSKMLKLSQIQSTISKNKKKRPKLPNLFIQEKKKKKKKTDKNKKKKILTVKNDKTVE